MCTRLLNGGSANQAVAGNKGLMVVSDNWEAYLMGNSNGASSDKKNGRKNTHKIHTEN